MKGNKNFDRIEAYLFDQMTEEEKKQFELELAENAELANELALHRLEHRSMRMLLHTDLRANMAEWQKEKDAAATETEGSAKLVSFRRRILAFAAAACVLLLAGFFVNRWLAAPDFSGMADKLFEETSPTVRGSSPAAPATGLAEALVSMQQKDYAQALVQLQAVTDTSYRDLSLFLRGECHYRTGDYPAAVHDFQELIRASALPANRQKAEWYLLLTYLKTDRKGSSFNSLLQKILSEPGHAFYPEAVRLQQTL